MGSADDPPEGGKPEQIKPEQMMPEQLKPEQTRPEGGGPEVSGPGQSGPRKSSIGANRTGKPAADRPKPDTPLLQPQGSIQFQDASTKPRPATPAELRARQKAADKQRELEAAQAAAEAKRARQKRILMGSAAAVGVVGLVAGVGYWLLSPEHVTAQCVQDDPNGQPVIVPDSYCTGHTPGMNGFFFWGGHSYRYYYGSTGSVGQRPIGGSTTIPKGATVTTKSGTTIQRGGIGGSGGKGSSGS